MGPSRAKTGPTRARLVSGDRLRYQVGTLGSQVGTLGSQVGPLGSEPGPLGSDFIFQKSGLRDRESEYGGRGHLPDAAHGKSLHDGVSQCTSESHGESKSAPKRTDLAPKRTRLAPKRTDLAPSDGLQGVDSERRYSLQTICSAKSLCSPQLSHQATFDARSGCKDRANDPSHSLVDPCALVQKVDVPLT